MAGTMTFSVTVYHINTEALPELAERVKNLTPVFHEIIDEWALMNNQKFNKSVGMEFTGVDIDPTVRWEALSLGYIKQKQRDGFSNQIMVRTGDLRAALTNPKGFFRMVNPQQAIFGTPNDPEDLMKVIYNFKKRQTIFLSDADKNMIRKKINDFLSVPTQKSYSSIKQEIAQMDVDFGNAVNK